MEIKTILIEDIEAERTHFKLLLERNFLEFKVIGEADSLEKGFEEISTKKPDIVFFDINLQIGTGFDLLNRCLNEDIADFEIVFLTGETNREYPVRAIHYSALDFLYKPLEISKLEECMARVKEKIQNKSNSFLNIEQLKVLIEHLKPEIEAQDKSIVFKRAGGIREIIRPDDILYCTSSKDTTLVHLRNGHSFYAMNNLSFYSKLLTIDYNFFRISDTHLINLNWLQRVHTAEEMKVEMTTGLLLPASRRRGRELKHYLETSPKIQVSVPEVKSSLFSVIRKILGR